MYENKFEKRASRFLGEAIKKRWSLAINKRRGQCWIANMPDQKYGSFSIVSYDDRQPDVLRLTDRYRPIISWIDQKQWISSNHFELTFLIDETEEIIPWALENYSAVASVHEALEDEWLFNCRLGEAPGYLWTKSAWSYSRCQHRIK